jgi:hypothetical protein
MLSHLYHGELGEWCTDRLTGWKNAVDRVNSESRMRESSGGRAVRPDDGVDKRHWMQIEKAFCIRMAALAQAAPPYAALYGLVKAGLVSQDWANRQAALYPSHTGLPVADQGSALQMRPTTNGWLDLRAQPWNHEGSAFNPTHGDFPAEAMLADLFDRMRAYFAANAPLGQLGAEKGVARLCWLMASFGYAYRNNDTFDEPIFRLFRQAVPTVERLLAAAPEPTVDELVALARRFHDSGALAELRRLVLQPNFVTLG